MDSKTLQTVEFMSSIFTDFLLKKNEESQLHPTLAKNTFLSFCKLL